MVTELKEFISVDFQWGILRRNDGCCNWYGGRFSSQV